MKEFYLTQTDGIWVITEEPTENKVTIDESKIQKWLDGLNKIVATLEEPKPKRKPRTKKTTK